MDHLHRQQAQELNLFIVIQPARFSPMTDRLARIETRRSQRELSRSHHRVEMSFPIFTTLARRRLLAPTRLSARGCSIRASRLLQVQVTGCYGLPHTSMPTDPSRLKSIRTSGRYLVVRFRAKSVRDKSWKLPLERTTHTQASDSSPPVGAHR